MSVYLITLDVQAQSSLISILFDCLSNYLGDEGNNGIIKQEELRIPFDLKTVNGLKKRCEIARKKRTDLQSSNLLKFNDSEEKKLFQQALADIIIKYKSCIDLMLVTFQKDPELKNELENRLNITKQILVQVRNAE